MMDYTIVWIAMAAWAVYCLPKFMLSLCAIVGIGFLIFTGMLAIATPEKGQSLHDYAFGPATQTHSPAVTFQQEPLSASDEEFAREFEVIAKRYRK